MTFYIKNMPRRKSSDQIYNIIYSTIHSVDRDRLKQEEEEFVFNGNDETREPRISM